MTSHVEAARQRLRDRERARAERLEVNRLRAGADCRAIVDMIVKECRPVRVYQWGSVLRPNGFRDYSDIDIAVEGIGDAQLFFEILGQASKMTSFPVDLVQMEKVAPEYAEEIRQYGKVVYERG